MRTTSEILKDAKAAKKAMSALSEEQKNNALKKAAEFLLRDCEKILEANAADTAAAKGSVSEVMLDRLTLTKERIKAMADGIIEVAELPDPTWKELDRFVRPNGLEITRMSVPMGVIGIIFESRPNVTSDAAALCFKSGNACVLRGGKEAINSNTAISESIRDALEFCGITRNAVNLITDTSRDSAAEMMTAKGFIDLLIPRGGAGLIKACVENAKIPCIETGTGICHIYVDETADQGKALDIVDNAKTSRPSVCNAAEVCLVNRKIAAEFLPKLYKRLVPERAAAGLLPVELRLDKEAAAFIPGTPASDKDFDTEFLDYVMAVKIVSDVDEAIAHIAIHSTGHSEAIVTENKAAAEEFTSFVDSAAVYVNASTRFTDGGVFGLGCEIGISTQKMHARGPMGLKEMTSYKYVIKGDGHIR